MKNSTSSAKSLPRSKTKSRGSTIGIGDIVKVIGEPHVGKVIAITQRRSLIERLDESGIQEIYENHQLVILKRSFFVQYDS